MSIGIWKGSSIISTDNIKGRSFLKSATSFWLIFNFLLFFRYILYIPVMLQVTTLIKLGGKLVLNKKSEWELGMNEKVSGN